MTAAFLQSELLSLIQDSKRKQSDVRTSAEKSLTDLRAISVTSETQLAGDLLRKSYFIDPFVLACSSKYAKLAVTGTICLQRLVASKAIPPERLADVLDAFQDAAHQGLDVQLKILQALPSLLQLYTAELHGEPLAKILSLCGGLVGSKTGMVSGTASATFQQLITSVFDRKASRHHRDSDGEEDEGPATEDAIEVFVDMCMIIKGEKPQFLKVQGLSLRAALEVVENCLSSDDLSLLELSQCMAACKSHLVAGTLEILEKSNNYAVFAQCLRITFLLAARYMADLSTELLGVFGIILNWLDRGVEATWKRVLCIEFFRDICLDFDLLRIVYQKFDLAVEAQHIVQNAMAVLVRIAAEDPSLIGLGRQSTMPTDGMADSDASVTGSVGVQDIDAVGSVMQASSNVAGISTKWSTISSPLLEQMDRSNPPDIPETYIYTIILACVAAFSDGLSKFVMPQTVPVRPSPKLEDNDETTDTPQRKNSQRAQKYQRLLNPLKRDDLPNLQEMQLSAKLIEDCWPAILAICSTFLNSALDSYFYHILVRTVQKLAQVSGVMELLTPRDALLTTLAKVSVPLNAPSLIAILHGNKLARKYQLGDDIDDSDSIKSPIQGSSRLSIDVSRQTLNVRNLLCLRALLNLGIALGPTLGEDSWFIVVQALQQVEALMSVSPTVKSAISTSTPQSTQSAENDTQTSLATEIAAVGTASRRMIDSTRTYSDAALEVLTRSIFKMVDSLFSSAPTSSIENGEAATRRPVLTPRTPTHRSTRSVSGAFASSSVLKVEAEFVLKSIGDLARVNLYRFAMQNSRNCSWNLIVARLLQMVGGSDFDPTLRLQAASAVDMIAMETIKFLEKQNQGPEALNALQQDCLVSLSKQIELLYKDHEQQDSAAAEIEIHRRLLEALEDIVSHAGDSLKSGWRIVFEVLQQTVRGTRTETKSPRPDEYHVTKEDIMYRTVSPAFRTIQLIVSDFMDSIDPESTWVLVQLLPLFGMQELDVNISLTTATLFSNVIALILAKGDRINVTENLSADMSPVEDPDSIIVAESSTLWFAAMMHLAELCGDHRSDVRNGAIRVLLSIFSRSGEQLTPEMWNLSIAKVLIPLLGLYSTSNARKADVLEWHASYSHLLAGVQGLVQHNAAAIATNEAFPRTWLLLLDEMKAMLDQDSLAGHAAVFGTAGLLLHDLKDVGVDGKNIVYPVLQLWSHYHPASVPDAHKDVNSEAFLVHARILAQAFACNEDALKEYSFENRDIAQLVMHSTRTTLLSSLHDRYLDDVKKLDPVQEAVINNLRILRGLMVVDQRKYSLYVLDLIDSVLTRHAPHTIGQKRAQPQLKTGKQPTLVAFMSKCITLLRDVIPRSKSQGDWVQDLAVPATLEVIAKVIRTKYTDIPCNASSPAWQDATSTVIEITEAVQNITQPLTEEDITALSPSLPKIIEAILDAPALEDDADSVPEATRAKHETFDMESFQRTHAAMVPILQQTAFPFIERKRYILTLFRSSLVAKPWYGDFTSDLLGTPLANFGSIRAGSIRKPEFYVRQSIKYQAVDAMFDLVSKPSEPDSHSHDSDASELAKHAAPYLLIRIAHTVKTFLADQQLRGLSPPPRACQKELSIILTHALRLKVQRRAFAELAALNLYNVTSAAPDDDRTHLRILYSLVLQLQEFWTRLPQAKICAWQKGIDGLAIEAALHQWGRVLAEQWVNTGNDVEVMKAGLKT